MCRRQSRKVIWDMINTLFLTRQLSNLLLLLSFSTRKHKSMASRAINFQISLKYSEFKTTHNTFRDCPVQFSDNLSRNSCKQSETKIEPDLRLGS